MVGRFEEEEDADVASYQGSLTADTELVNPGKLQGGMISVPDILQILRGQQHRNPQLLFGRPVVLPLCLFVPGGFNTVIATLCPNLELITRLRKKSRLWDFILLFSLPSLVNKTLIYLNSTQDSNWSLT